MDKYLKIGILTIVILLFASCLNNDDNEYVDPIESVSQVSIDSVKIPQASMQVFTTQTIKTFSTLKSSCENFYGYDYQKAGLTRNIVAYLYKINGKSCGTTTYKSDDSFNFTPEEVGTYTFNFSSKKKLGGDSIIVKTIVVTN